MLSMGGLEPPRGSLGNCGSVLLSYIEIGVPGRIRTRVRPLRRRRPVHSSHRNNIAHEDRRRPLVGVAGAS